MRRWWDIPEIQKLQVTKKTLILYHRDELVILAAGLGLFPLCRHFIHRCARVTIRTRLRSNTNCALTGKKKRVWLQVQYYRFRSYSSDRDIPSFALFKVGVSVE